MKLRLHSNRGYFILAGRRPWDELPTALLCSHPLSNALISHRCIPSALGVLRDKSRRQITTFTQNISQGHYAIISNVRNVVESMK